MVLEVAEFTTTDPADFEAAMHELLPVIAAGNGYRGHTVERSVETPGRYFLIVKWDSIDAHQTFRDSDGFGVWRERTGPHREGVRVEHTETVVSNSWSL
ncbi:MAG: antibiotic biosynthesis monooxygenase [Acidimicrobiia bacterium]|nr:antibiotic biosynthesis monooxygenase [Acidimicrobiia bacterium]